MSAREASPGQAAPFTPPHPGSKAMPRWDAGELPPAPVFTWRDVAMFLGPGLVMGASAIGGGEWLLGPLTTARFGTALMWLATLSILGQVVYNVEISRYALYCGEPIFTGKFRTLPGPMFWVVLYLILDLGSVLPYLASNAAVPLFTMLFKRLPETEATTITLTVGGLEFTDRSLLKTLGCLIFASVFVPLIVGGKVYNSLKAVMTFKLVSVVGFLLFLAVFFSSPATWWRIFWGFFEFGNVPVVAADGGSNVDNLFVALWEGRTILFRADGAVPPRSLLFDLSVIGTLASMAAISGNGGLTNTPTSNYTRDQGWGMGSHVGAIPSIVGGHAIQLSHVGMVFPVTPESLRRWKGWVRHVAREQWCVWMPACFLGLALPSMLSLVFLPPGTIPKSDWLAASMTADGVARAVASKFGPGWGPPFWLLTLACGFLVLGTSMISTADGVLRRWVDVFWTALPFLRKWDPKHIGRLYFTVLCVYLTFGLVMLTLVPGDKLLKIATGILYNYALGFSCFHVLVVNLTLLPPELRPGWFPRVGLLLGGLFFTIVAIMSTTQEIPKLVAELKTLTG
uniref:Divalent metal cation transporter n=1 Tax=Schlesneria paludicola TaxID=360056 RepID=A0A7C4LK46_9PLAN